MIEAKDLVGAWTMLRWTALKNGQADGYPMGKDAQGQIIYAAQGRMAALLMRADFKDKPQGSLADADSSIAYGGTYRIEGDQVVHDVAFASLPHWIGTPLVRTMAWQDDDLLLKTAPQVSKSGNRYEHELLWRRVAN